MRKEEVIFAINPRTKSLIEKFKPILNQLSPEARSIMKFLQKNSFDKNSLQKTLNLKDITPFVDELLKKKILRDNKLTETRRNSCDDINLIPEF